MIFFQELYKYQSWGFLTVQWLRFCAPNAGSPGSVPSQGTRFHMLQLRLGTAKKKKKKNNPPRNKTNTGALPKSYTNLMLTEMSKCLSREESTVPDLLSASSRGFSDPPQWPHLCCVVASTPVTNADGNLVTDHPGTCHGLGAAWKHGPPPEKLLDGVLL